MRIAILTQPPRGNYGGIMQSYALQYILKELRHIPILIEKDFHKNIPLHKLIMQLPKRLFTKYILHKRKYIFSERAHIIFTTNLRKYTNKFIHQYIDIEIVNKYSDIDLSRYDTIIVGSDQVWRAIFNIDQLEDMFLSFIPNNINIKRISYAASFGTNEWEFTPKQTTVCTELLSRFDAVSVREIDGIELCKKYLKRNDAVCVLDPTLLLNKGT